MQIDRDYQVLTPAYGRDYPSAAKAKEDFLTGKDFLLQSINYGFDVPCSIRDFKKGVKVTLRYKNKSATTMVTV